MHGATGDALLPKSLEIAESAAVDGSAPSQIHLAAVVNCEA